MDLERFCVSSRTKEIAIPSTEGSSSAVSRTRSKKSAADAKTPFAETAGPPGMKLILEDGTEYDGTSFGAVSPVVGEVVFTTAMSGYVEALTDPSFRGQILVLTYPLAGNYGVPAPRPAGTLDGPFESDRIQVQGLVVQHAIRRPSHHASVRTLGDWLTSEGIPAVTGIDTRTLTRRLRERGTMRGWLVPADRPIEDSRRAATGVEMQRELFRLVAPTEVTRIGAGNGPRVLLVDIGVKDNLIRSVLKRGAVVTRAPWFADLGELANDVDGVLLSNERAGCPGAGAAPAAQPADHGRLHGEPDPGPRRGRGHLQAPLRTPWGEPAGPGDRDQALLHHQPESRVRRPGGLLAA
jgi:hypothetical protein